MKMTDGHKFVVERERNEGGGCDIFTEFYDTLEEAVEAAQREWDRLTEYEKKRSRTVAGRADKGYLSNGEMWSIDFDSNKL